MVFTLPRMEMAKQRRSMIQRTQCARGREEGSEGLLCLSEGTLNMRYVYESSVLPSPPAQASSVGYWERRDFMSALDVFHQVGSLEATKRRCG